ncbi:uncharacterized protein LOC124898665 [Capsicum annuum]|uniref:uncharacterized protein LOC124898665 n=1 Tax=Capsicum annuum TaxID=4072 RepID=UPI001FB093CB|nr:uncharacterized protein LOC124898665 [Capsicum annuum]
MTMRAHDKVEVFDIYKALKLPVIYEELSAISIIDVESDCLSDIQVREAMTVLKRRKKAIGWQIFNITGINLAFCMHKIYMEEILKTRVQQQRRLNLVMKDVVRKEITIAPEDQEKTTFTCPYSTYAFIRMAFGLCNAPATFQRCMMEILYDMVEEFVEVFMDDLFAYDNSFEVAREKRLLKLTELDEFHLHAYENDKLYKEKTKKWLDKQIQDRVFESR